MTERIMTEKELDELMTEFVETHSYDEEDDWTKYPELGEAEDIPTGTKKFATIFGEAHGSSRTGDEDREGSKADQVDP